MILLDVDNEMNSLITLFYTLAITASLSAAGGSNSVTMVASMQSNVTMENTVSAAVTATISNTPMASSYISPSLVTKSMVSSLSVRSLASSHFKPSDSTISPTHSPKMSSLFVLESSSSATILPKPSSVGPMSGHSPEVGESSRSLTSNQSTVSLLRETTSVMTSYPAGILTVTASNVNSSSFPLAHPSPTSQAIVPTSTSSSRPTTPVEGVKTVSMEMTLALTFKDDYRDPNSEAYKDLTTNLTRSLEKTYKNIEGFIGIRILLIREGSVVCTYIVILAKDSKADEEMLKNTLENASKKKEFGFKVTSVKVEEEPTAKTEEKLPNWALITMIALGSLSFVFLITVICVCVKCRRSKGENMAYGISTGELEMHTYEIVQADHGKLRAKTDGKNSTMERRIIGSHSNPTYSSNGAHADY